MQHTVTEISLERQTVERVKWIRGLSLTVNARGKKTEKLFSVKSVSLRVQYVTSTPSKATNV